MGDVLRILVLVAAVAAFTVPAAAYDGPTQSTGGKKSAKASDKSADKKDTADKSDGEKDLDSSDEKKKTAAMVQQAFEAGVKSYGAGKFDDAQRAFDAALRGGLPSNQMAKLLYYRGLTFRKQGKPGLAISDLTSAVWLKGGLSDAERADAVKTRALAYNEAGISDVPPVPQSPYAEAPTLPGAAPPPAATGWQTATSDAGGASTPMPASPASTSNAPAAPTPASDSGGGIGGFFSSLFGGGSSSSSSEAKPPEATVTTASIDNPPPPPPASQAETSSWTGTTQVATAPPPPPSPQPQPSSAATGFETKVAVAATPAAPSGKYRLQVASVRSQAEAESLAQRVVEQHGNQLGGRQPEIDEAVIGSMGTFYRVRLGPYANAKEPQQLCGALRADGFDCLVVTQ